MRGDDLSERLLDFGVRVIRLMQALPKNIAGKHVAGQLLRSGTSSGANYEEARGAESKQDFIHKLAIAWKETRESWYWLRLIGKSEMVQPTLVAKLQLEADERRESCPRASKPHAAAKTYEGGVSILHS
jgi:four helix bundle protein